MSQLDSSPPAAPPPAGSPFFTIVIATCRRPDLLVLALNSVLAQSFQDFEIVVVDDASSDHTPDVIAQYTDPRITYLRQPTNMGNSHALNRGIQQARGRWVAILDDDDRYPPEFLATVHAALQDAPATVLCAIPARHHVTVTPAGETVLQRLNTFGYRAPRIIAGADFRRNPIGASGGLVVKPHAALAVGGFDPAFYIVHDTDFLLRLATQGDMLVVLAAHLWVYSYPSRDHVTRDFTAYAVNMERLADHHHAALRAHPAPLLYLYRSSARMYFAMRLRAEGRRALGKAVRLAPFAPKSWLLWGVLESSPWLPKSLRRRIFRHARHGQLTE